MLKVVPSGVLMNMTSTDVGVYILNKYKVRSISIIIIIDERTE